MDLIFDFGLKIEFFHHFWNHITNLLCFGDAGLADLLLNCFLDGPEGVGVLDFLEDELALF